MPAPTLTRDPTWLQVEVCREYLRQACKRDNTECKYAHPSSNVDIQNGKVTVCFDAFKDRCTRSNCKYFHAPAQMKADLEMRGKMSLMRQKSEQLALQNHHQSSAAHAVAQAAAQLALIHQLQMQQQQHQQHNPQAAAQLAAVSAGLHNPFLQNVPPVFPNSATAANTAIVQYHQILQQNYGLGAAPGAAGPNGAAPGNPAAGTLHPPVTVSSPPSNGIGGLSPPNGFFDPSTLALAANAVGVPNGTCGGPLLSSAESSPSPPKVLSTIEVCREFGRGACPRSEEDCRFAHVHPDSNVAIDSVENRVTVCMDYVKNGGVCQRQASQDKCKYFHPPQHLQEKFKSINNNNTLNNNNIINNNSISVAPLNPQQLQPAQAANPMLSPQTPAAVFTFQSPLNLQQSYANSSSLIPNYGKVLRLDSATGAGAIGPGSKLPPTPVTPAGTSPIGAAALNPFNHFSNPGAPPPSGNLGQPPASPHQTAAAAFFYATAPSHVYAAHLSAAQAAAVAQQAQVAANSNQSAAAAALLPSAHSPAFLSSQGATLMNGSPSSAALFASSGRYAAF